MIPYYYIHCMMNINMNMVAPYVLLIYPLYVWFKEYKLQYLLRITLAIFSISLLAKLFCSYVWSECQYSRETWYALIFSSCAVLLMLFVRYHWALPLNIKRKLHDVTFKRHRRGFARKKNKTAEELTLEKYRSFTEDLPAVFPNGWVPVLDSMDLGRGDSITVTVMDMKICVFRSEEGIAYIVDAYCPHLGAELAEGGRVVKECIECPFHQWQFSGKDGNCTVIPYTLKIPENARIKTWPSCEKNGYIFLWFHAEEEFKETPCWEMPSVPEVESGEWVYRGKTDHEVHCHVQEIPENGADIAHLNAIHSESVLMGQGFVCRIISLYKQSLEHQWTSHGWFKDEVLQFKARIKLDQKTLICGKNCEIFNLDIDVTQIGPLTVHLQIQSRFGRAVFLQHVTPEGPLNHRIIHKLYTERRVMQFLANMLIFAEAAMLERDIEIWNCKRFIKSPLLTREDKMIKSFRRWYSQFYSPNSPTLRQCIEKRMDW